MPVKPDVPIAAIVTPQGVRPLTSAKDPDEEVTEKQLAEKGYTVRLFMRILRELARFGRRFTPGRLDFEDVELGTGTTHYFAHPFDGRVRWWVVDQVGSIPELVRIDDGSTTKDVLVLYSGVSTVATVRVEAAG